MENPLLIEDDEEDVPLTRFERTLEWIMFRYRFIFVILFLMPVSCVFDAYSAIRNWVVNRMHSAPGAHVRKVEVIRKELREWNEGGRKKKLANARAGWLSMSYRFPLWKDNCTRISTDKLIDILELDENEMTVRCEPGVTMGQLTKYLVPKGYTLSVLPELDDLTVGGLINGCGLESGSFKSGFIADICVSYEVVLANASIEIVKPTSKNAGLSEGALFYGIPWSLGSLCFLVAATFRIIRCKKYVKLTYTRVSTTQEMCEVMDKVTNRYTRSENVDFVEALMYTKDEGVMMTGEFSDGPESSNETINAIGVWHAQWFYIYVKQLIDRQPVTVEYIPLRDYYHRHSRSIFWELKDIVPFGNHLLFRWCFGWSCPPSIALLKLTTPSILRKLYDRKHVIQDMLVPLKALEQTIEVFHEKIEIYPLWLCPFNLSAKFGLVSKSNEEMYVDVGAYGVCEKESYRAKRTTRELEAFVREVNGYQMPYADVYMTREEHSQMFNMSHYNYCRVILAVEDVFPDVYDKICRQNRH